VIGLTSKISTQNHAYRPYLNENLNLGQGIRLKSIDFGIAYVI